MSISKNVLIGCLCFFIVFWHVFKNKSKTKLLNPCPKPLTFPQGYLFFLGFYMVSNGTRDLKQAETTTNKFAMPKGGKWQRVRSCHFFLPVPQNNNEPRKQNTKKPKKQKKTRLHTPRGGGQMQFVGSFFCFLFFLVFVKRKETAKVRLQRAN